MATGRKEGLPQTCPCSCAGLLLASGQPGPQHLDADFARILLQASGGDKAMQKVAANLQVMVAELPPLEGTTEPRNLEVWLPKRVNREWKTE